MRNNVPEKRHVFGSLKSAVQAVLGFVIGNDVYCMAQAYFNTQSFFYEAVWFEAVGVNQVTLPDSYQNLQLERSGLAEFRQFLDSSR